MSCEDGISSTPDECSVRLPVVFGIGFVGSMSTADESACRPAAIGFLEREKASINRTLYAIVTIAAAVDLFWAECCFALEIPVQIMLPVHSDGLRARFSPSDWARFGHAMDRAFAVEVVAGDGSAFDEAYRCGIATVQQSELVVFVRAAKAASACDELVQFARAIDRPVVDFLSHTGNVEGLEIAPRHKHDRELEFLNSLPSGGAQLVDDSSRSLVCAWQAKLSANAGIVAPEVRRLAAVPILCTALAAILSGAAPRLQFKLLWTGVGTLLGLAAALMPAALRLEKRQALWIRIRTAAEVSRSIQALWEAPMRYDVVGPEILPELSSMVRSLNVLKAFGGKSLNTDVEIFKKQYREERVLNQMRYFSGQVRQAAGRGRRYRRVSRFCVLVAILLSAAVVLEHLFLKSSEGVWVGLLISSLFQAATVAGAVLVVQDCDRRERRYQELYDALKSLDIELGAFRTWPLVNSAVNKIERALLVELIEWRSLLQNRKMPRN